MPKRSSPELEAPKGRALEELVDEVLAELARGRAELEGERACATCQRARGCALLGRSLNRAPAPASRRLIVAGRCADWQQQQGEDHQTDRDSCPAAVPAHTCDP